MNPSPRPQLNLQMNSIAEDDGTQGRQIEQVSGAETASDQPRKNEQRPTLGSGSGSGPGPDIDQLRSLLRSDQLAGLSLLWDLHAEQMFALLYAIIQSAADAEDVLHNLFIKIGKQRHKLAAAKNFKAYLYRLTRNAGIDAYKQQKKSRGLHSSAELNTLLHSQTSPVDHLHAQDTRALVAQALSELPEGQRIVVTLKINDDKTFAEISEMLAISANTCASRYRYALEKLRNQLQGVWP